MKNSEINSSEPNQGPEMESIFAKTLLSQKPTLNSSRTCSNNNLSTQMCINKQCEARLPFVCSNMQCTCQQLHEACPKTNLRFITKKLTQKVTHSQTFKQEIQSTFERIIDSLSDLRNKIVHEIDFNFKYANMHNLEYLFFRGLQKNQFHETLIGQSETIWKLLTENIQQKPNCFDILKDKINDLETIINEKQAKISTFIDNQVKKLKKQNLFFQESSLGLSEIQNFRKIEGFFGKRIINSNLLYRASDHNFQISKFFEICGLQKNIMVVCETNEDRIIGGYTPLSFNGGQMDCYAEDPSRETFIFSLTFNDKFTMKTSGNAIYRVSGQERICFGGCEFEICNHADRINKCRSYSLNYYFQNDKYESNKKESFERFNGNLTEYFTVKEWEVWKITLEEDP